MFFDGVQPTNQIAVMDASLADMTDASKWAGTFYTNGDNNENYVKISDWSGEMNFYFSYRNGEDFFTCSGNFTMTQVSDYAFSVACESGDFPGEYPAAVKISEDFQNVTYTIDNTPYGTLTATVPRQG